MKAWINAVLLSKAYNGKTNLFKKELSDAVTVKAKDVYGEQWDNSSCKQMLNQMRRYVQGQESSFEWDNYLISSVAAVITKGEDWNKLLDFMHSKGMSDYRLAFAFYGELNGFANLTRDFTDNLFELEDKRYVADVYTELYGQLLGESPKLQNEKNNDGSGFIEKEKVLPVHSLEERVWRAWEQIQKGLSKKKELGGELKRVLEQNENNQDISLFMEKLDQEIWKRTNQPWKKLYKELNPGYTSNAEKQKRPLKKKSDKASFDMGQNGIFDFPDIECLHHFSSVVRKRLKDNWNYTAKKGYMTDEHISFFINLCKKEGRGDSDHKELKDVFTDDVAQKVLKALKNRK